MKRKFEQLLDAAANYYGITRQDLLTKRGSSLRSEARYLLYFLCARAGMRNSTIHNFMISKGYELSKSDISRGVVKWQDLIAYDKDLYEDVKNLEDND